MSRVLLFVQGEVGTSRGPKRPVSYGVPRGHDGNGLLFLTPRQQRARERAERWWIVECANAEAGRLIIGCAVVGCDSPEGCACRSQGRILASGVR